MGFGWSDVIVDDDLKLHTHKLVQNELESVRKSDFNFDQVLVQRLSRNTFTSSTCGLSLLIKSSRVCVFLFRFKLPRQPRKTCTSFFSSADSGYRLFVFDFTLACLSWRVFFSLSQKHAFRTDEVRDGRKACQTVAGHLYKCKATCHCRNTFIRLPCRDNPRRSWTVSSVGIRSSSSFSSLLFHFLLTQLTLCASFLFLQSLSPVFTTNAFFLVFVIVHQVLFTMTKYHESEHQFKFSWEQVCRAFWCRYPNPYRSVSN